MRLLGIVTLYHPQRFVENLSSYVEGLDGLYIWDNTPEGDTSFSLPAAMESKVVHVRRGANVGIGQALNAAATYALHHGYTHLLTMDQDSCFRGNSFLDYIHRIEEDVDPTHMAYVPLINRSSEEEEMKEVSGMIVSGTIFPTTTFRDAGLFNEAFVIDAIDTEYALRIHRQGGKIMQVAVGRLQHELGQPLRKRFLCWHPVSLNYSPLRTYYIARNFLYLSKKYPEFHRPELLWKLVWERPFYILCLETRKRKKLKALLIGIWQGLRGDLAHDRYFHQLNALKR